MCNPGGRRSDRSAAAIAVVLAQGFSIGCDDGEGVGRTCRMSVCPGDCDFSCPTQGLGEGNSSISGVKDVDALFRALLELRTELRVAASDLQGRLLDIRRVLGFDARATPEELLEAMRVRWSLERPLSFRAEEVRCASPTKWVLEMWKYCADRSDEASSVTCRGGCGKAPGEPPRCSRNAATSCVGVAPELMCPDSCVGACWLDLSGPCRGDCYGECSAGCERFDEAGLCAGPCTGSCTGRCEMAGGGSCGGRCIGSCEYFPDTDECTSTTEPLCTTDDEYAACTGTCSGDVAVRADLPICEAAVGAVVARNAQCGQPGIQFHFVHIPGATARERAEFDAFRSAYRKRLTGLLTTVARARVLLAEAERMNDALAGPIPDELGRRRGTNVTLATKSGLDCAQRELEHAPSLLHEPASDLAAEVDIAVAELAVLGG